MNRLYDKIFRSVMEKNRVHDVKVLYVAPHVIRCAALVYKYNGSFRILCKNDLSSEVQLFVLLHELGHIVLHQLHKNPQLDWSCDVESEINLWAVEELRHYVSNVFYCQLLKEFSVSEKTGFARIDLELSSYINEKGESYDRETI